MGVKQILEKIEIVEAPEETKQYFCSIHKKDDGYIAVVIKNKKWNQWHYSKPELLDILGQLTNADRDVYISVNDFYKPKRTAESLFRINALYMDIDCHSDIINKDDINGVINYLYDEFFDEKIPAPNIIINSGRGVQLLWTIEDLPKQGLPLWQIVQQRIYKVLQQMNYKSFEVDSSVVGDVARVLRLPGTVNTKGKVKAELMYINDKFRYRLDDIVQYYFPDLQIAKNKKKKEDKSKKEKKEEENKVKCLFNGYTLVYNRMLDIVKLAEIRKYDLKGYRELFCFLYRYYNMAYYHKAEIALNNVLKFNDQFVEPLSVKEVKEATKSAEKAYYEHQEEYKKGYNYNNKTLIELLNITAEEQKKLSTIIGKEEKYRRNNIKRTPRNEKGLTEKQQELADLKAKILELKNKGFNNTQISKKLGIDRKKVSRLANS